MRWRRVRRTLMSRLSAGSAQTELPRLFATTPHSPAASRHAPVACRSRSGRDGCALTLWQWQRQRQWRRPPRSPTPPVARVAVAADRPGPAAAGCSGLHPVLGAPVRHGRSDADVAPKDTPQAGSAPMPGCRQRRSTLGARVLAAPRAAIDHRPAAAAGPVARPGCLA